MRKQNVFKRFLIVLVFVIFPFTGYFTVSHVTASQADCGTGSCIEGSALVTELTAIYSVIAQDIILATQILEAYFKPLSIDVGDGAIPVMDWSFREMSDWFDTFWYYNLLPPWQVMTSQLATANVEQTLALGSFADAANIIRNQGRMLGGGVGGVVRDNKTTGDGYGGDLGIKDHREERPSEQVCSAGTVMSGMERATVFSDAFTGAAAYGKLSISSNFAGSNSASGHAEYMCNRWQNNGIGCAPLKPTAKHDYGYVGQWCNAFFNGGFAGCTMPGGTQVGPGATSADVDVAGMIFAQDTIPLDATQDPDGLEKRNLDEIVTNLAEAFVKDPVTAGVSGEDGILQSVSYKAKRQVVYDGLYYIISRRVPGGLRTGSPGVSAPSAGPDFVQLLQEIRAETGEGASTSTNPSRNEVLRAMMTQRYQSGKYALQGIDEPENNQREQVVEQALQLIQMSDQMDLMDHYALLLASQVSTEIVAKTNFIQATEGAPLQ